MSDIRITGFEVIEKLGQGGMATVWKARQLSLDRIVAIKFLSMRLAKDAEDVKRFQSEAQATARLKHPSIVQVYDANAESGLYYFVMEYIGGYTVGEWVRRKGVLQEKEVLTVADCVADALGYAWETQRIIHCDIKPDNVMIDSDGTVKVADLGLARTISAMTAAAGTSDEVLGTPAYMAPEQARGDLNLDCRTDIYSLGAMMYHMLTGRFPFQGNDEDKILQLQLGGQIADPMDVNPAVSKPVCWLLERMLAKDRENRYPDWRELRADLARVLKGHMPHHRLPERATSTVRRSTHRTKVDTRVQAAAAQRRREDDRRSPVPLILLGAAALVLLIVFAVTRNRKPRPEPAWVQPREITPVPQPVVPAPPLPPPQASHVEQDARDMYEYAAKWEGEHPGSFEQAVRHYRKVLDETKGTKYSLMAEEAILRLGRARVQAITAVRTDLGQRAEALKGAGDMTGAAALFETYTGPYADETRVWRLQSAQELRQQVAKLAKDQQDATKRQAGKFAGSLDAVADKVMSEGPPAALIVLDEALKDADLAGRAADLQALRKLLADATAVDARILESFRAQVGKEVVLQTQTGERRFVIKEVRDGVILGTQQINMGGGLVSSEHQVALKDLAAREKLSRMGADDEPAVALVKGLMAAQSKAFEYAKKYWGTLPPLLGERLLQRVARAEQETSWQDAEKALARTLQGVGVAVAGAYDEKAWLEALTQKKTPPAREAAAEFRRKHGETDFGKRAEPVVAALERGGQGAAAEPAAAVEAPRAPVPGGPGSTAEQFLDKIRQRNLGLDEQDVRLESADDGAVLSVVIVSATVMDISPVAELRQLRKFSCSSVPPDDQSSDEPPCRLRDIGALANLPLEALYLPLTRVESLSPIRGLKLRLLDVRGTGVRDLSPLKDMPLTSLNVRGTAVKDLSPLTGMRLKVLDIGRTPVFDFRILSSMPIEWLGLESTQVKDLSFVKGMPLASLVIARTGVFSLTSLKGLPLRDLYAPDTPIKDLSPLKGMTTLRDLNVARTGVADISVVAGMPLRSLDLSGTAVKEFAALKDLPLERLLLASVRIKDLSVLAALPLRQLDLAETPVEDLTPLETMNLEWLSITGTKVVNLRPVARLPLRTLCCQGLRVQDYGPLHGLPVEEIYIDIPDPGRLGVLRSMRNLRMINGEPVHAFLQGLFENRDEPPRPPRRNR